MPFPDSKHTPQPTPAPDFADGTAFGESYTMIRELGRGGMAIVYLMRERATGLERAVKVIHTKYLDDEEALARFSREARVVAQLDHPNIVATHSVRWIDGVGFGLVMDHVPGRTLKQILRDDPPISFERAQLILDDIAAGLGYAHERGIVHRDVKPENIFVEDASGRALLADFGIARSTEHDNHDNEVTVAGVAIGTPTYMAPEQIDGAPVDARSDLYSLGLVGWEMLTRRRPWDGETLYNVIYHQKHDQLPAIDALRPDTPVRLVYAIEGLLEKAPEARWQNAAQFRAELMSTEPVRRKEPQHAVPAPDETMAIAISPALKVRGRIRRIAPTGVVAAMLVGATFLFAWPSSGGFWDRGSSSKSELTATSTTQAPVVLHAPGANYGADSVAAGAQDSSVTAITPPAPATPVALVPATTDSARAAALKTLQKPLLPPIVATPAAAAVAASVPVTRTSSTVVDTPPVPAPNAGTNGRLTIAAGGAHTCLISSTGSAYCWGANNSGQLGDGATQTTTTPTAIAGTTHFTAIATGLSHTCGLSRAGAAFCWGNNERGQLGDGSRTSHDAPARVSFAQSFRSIVSGSGYSCGIGSDSETYCWGAGSRGQIGNGGPDDRTTPTRIATTVSFTSLAAGWNHVCGLSDGIAYCWGANDAGQLGDGSTADHSLPTQVHTSERFTTLSAGSAHTCGTTTSGAIYCWGDNRYGQLGDGTQSVHATPVAVSSSERFVSVSGGSVHTCALTASHEAWCWGRNTYGQLGDGTEASKSTPVLVSGAHDFATVKAFGSHTCGTTTSNELFCWGYNLDGQLGDGTRDHRLRPTYIQKPTG